MKEYQFEYTDQRYLTRLLGLSFLVFALMIFASIVTVDLIGLVPSIALAFVVPVFLFWMNKKNIKKHGTAVVEREWVEFKLKNNTRIDYAEIQQLKVGGYNGSSIEMKLKNKQYFFLRANVNFSDPASFAICCAGVFQAVDVYAVVNNLPVIKKKTAFENKLAFSR